MTKKKACIYWAIVEHLVRKGFAQSVAEYEALRMLSNREG